MGKYRQLLTERYTHRVPRVVADPEKDEELCKTLFELSEVQQKIRRFLRRRVAEVRRARREGAAAKGQNEGEKEGE